MAHPYSGHKQNSVGKRRANKLVHGNEYARGGRAEGGKVGSDQWMEGVRDHGMRYLRARMNISEGRETSQRREDMAASEYNKARKAVGLEKD